MKRELTEIARECSFPLNGLIEPGPGFCVGGPNWPFELVSRKGNRWTYVDELHSLRVESEVQVSGASVIIGHRLKNIGTEVSPRIDAVEPLHLVFGQPKRAWRSIFANGGSAESHYPPRAYRTRERSRSGRTTGWDRPELIQSDPGGRSSNRDLPLLIALASTSATSEGLFCGLEWSASWYMRWDAVGDRQSSLAAGIRVSGLRLQPGESLELPKVHLGFFTGGPAAGTNALRRYLYEHVCARHHGKLMIPRVNYSHWFGIGNHLDSELLSRQAERAAELGLEVFAVDASWFPGGFPEGVGNWHQVDGQKFPDGLEPLADYVRELGMEFGLWFEPERAVEDTAIVREHPEWFVAVPSPLVKKRCYHLNLGIRDAQDYVINMVGGWIERLGIRWSRWDYNIDPGPFWQLVDPTLKVQFSYLDGLYRVLDTLMANHPDWMVEACSSGGRRIDIGTIRRAHTCWFSDHTVDPLVCRYMQARANRFLPGHLLDSTVPVELGSGDRGFDDTAVLSRMLGKLAFDGDIASWSQSLTGRMARWVREFKAIRHLLVQDFYQLLPIPTTAASWDAVEFVSYSADEAALFVFAGEGGRRTVRVQGLKEDREYLVGRRLDGKPRRVRGSELLERGVPVELCRNEGGLWRLSLA